MLFQGRTVRCMTVVYIARWHLLLLPLVDKKGGGDDCRLLLLLVLQAVLHDRRARLKRLERARVVLNAGRKVVV